MSSNSFDFELEDFTMDEVFNSLDSLELVNPGPSLSDLYGYSKEFETMLHDEMNDDFKLTSLLYEAENNGLDRLMETNNHNVNQINIVPTQQNFVTMQGFSPAAYNVHEMQAARIVSNVPLPPPSIRVPDSSSYFHWTSELHAGFLGAIEQLGGFDKATPVNIMYLMNVKGLTIDHVQTHIQEYLQGTYFANTSTQMSAVARNTPVAPPEAVPSNSKAASKRPKRKPKAKKDSAAHLKAKCEAQIDRLQGAHNYYMDCLLQRAGQTIDSFGFFNDPGIVANTPQFVSNAPQYIPNPPPQYYYPNPNVMFNPYGQNFMP